MERARRYQHNFYGFTITINSDTLTIMRISYILPLIILLPSVAWAAGKNTPPYSDLSKENREYYVKIFNYTMDNVADNQIYHWDAGTAKGDIRVGKKYISKSKSICRDFAETFVIDNQSGKNEGSACERSGEGKGWCRLKHSDAHTCALETPQGISDQLLNNAETTLEKGTELLRNSKDWWGR